MECVVNDIDEIVQVVRFRQDTHAGEREVWNALRNTLFKYRLHQDQEFLAGVWIYTAVLISAIWLSPAY